MKCKNCLVVPACTEFCREAERTLQNLIKTILVLSISTVGAITAYILLSVFPHLTAQVKTVLYTLYAILTITIFIGVLVEEKSKTLLNISIIAFISIIFPVVLIVAFTIMLCKKIIITKLRKIFIKAKDRHFKLVDFDFDF